MKDLQSLCNDWLSFVYYYYLYKVTKVSDIIFSKVVNKYVVV